MTIPKKTVLTPALLLKGIIYTNVFLFIISLIYSGKNMVMSINPFYALTPSMDVLNFLGASGKIPIEQFHAWWSLITANWLHGSLLHIIFNMLALGTVAPLVMNEFGLFRMFSIYTITGAAGFFLSYLGNVSLTIGASSGLCGLIGALLYFGKSRGGEWGQRVFKQTSGWIISLLLFGFLIPNINNWGHGGGLLAGIFLGWAFGYNDKRMESRLDQMLSLVLMLLTAWLLIRSVIQGFFLIFI
ncbi:MAG: rhomboid family intramembrane serine protease [Desulfobacteraceae bacterium]|nr:rhomboid family intramembrane serine protease [Desulfobacteraceae bacterium]